MTATLVVETPQQLAVELGISDRQVNNLRAAIEARFGIRMGRKDGKKTKLSEAECNSIRILKSTSEFIDPRTWGTDSVDEIIEDFQTQPQTQAETLGDIEDSMVSQLAVMSADNSALIVSSAQKLAVADEKLFFTTYLNTCRDLRFAGMEEVNAIRRSQLEQVTVVSEPRPVRQLPTQQALPDRQQMTRELTRSLLGWD